MLKHWRRSCNVSVFLVSLQNLQDRKYPSPSPLPAGSRIEVKRKKGNGEKGNGRKGNGKLRNLPT